MTTPPAPDVPATSGTGEAVEVPDDEWVDVDLDVDLDDDSREPSVTQDEKSAGEEVPEPYFPNVDVFVRQFLALTFRRSLEGNHMVWCAEWWRHAEAINRLESLWRAWEHLRLDPAIGMSIWWRDHADHHMPALLNPDGPFKGCGSDRGHRPRVGALPTVTAPDGLFD